MIAHDEHRNDAWLRAFRHDVYSQDGVDGILDVIFSRLGIERGWCVEFGAWDGIHLSNTRHLIVDRGWSAVLIEGDAVKAAELARNYAAYKYVQPIHRFVNFTGPSSLDNILAATGIPQDFDFLSIDVDGVDYHVWDSIKLFRPKIVCIEFNPTMDHGVEYVQAADMNVHQGSSITSIAQLGKAKDYEPIAITEFNGIFVDKPYFDRFDIADNSIERLWIDRPYLTHMYSLYDGTIGIDGYGRLPWQDLPIRPDRIQVLPGPLRVFPPVNTVRWRKALLAVFRAWYTGDFSRLWRGRRRQQKS